MKKKLFISCPMKGRTEENIRKSMDKMYKIAEIVFNQELDVIPTYIEDNPPKNTNEPLWYLGKSIQMLSEADYFIGIRYSEVFRGCDIEGTAARAYNIPCTYVEIPEIMPDCIEIERKYYEQFNSGVTPYRPMIYDYPPVNTTMDDDLK